ncbi:death ligand signal enhancer [Pelobates fuscus]|uniref:death ligand signal enhancer n=1 Tax=Pelobates fuscus TaxID=191477 RepID=UPI002FE4C32E
MWRIPGALARALNRFHAVNIQGCVRGQADALGPSSLIPFGQNAGGKSSTLHSYDPKGNHNGHDQKKKGTYKSCAGQLRQHILIDAFGWGAIAVFFLHLARQVSYQKSTPGVSPEHRCPRKFIKHILCSLSQNQDPFVKQSIIPNKVKVSVWNDTQLQDDTVDDTPSLNSPPILASGYDTLHFSIDQAESRVDLGSPSTPEKIADSNEPTVHPSQQIVDTGRDPEESVEFAASRLLDVAETSFPVVLNIFGIVNARNGTDYQTAFYFFQESAENGYSKAQYNTGVCYEQGKGVTKNMAKAAEYYLLAANSGHNRAKYRFARYLLRDGVKVRPEDVQTALRMLKEAAQAGLKEAQAYLGVFYSREPYRDLQKAITHLVMAAENGDVQSRYYLGVCYEKGFGVPASKQEALLHYEKASKTGHGPAQQKLLEITAEQAQGTSSTSVSLKTAASSPCLPVLESLRNLTRTSSRYSANRTHSLGLLHSMSTGNLLAMSPQDGNSYILAPKNISLPLASLRAIGVG